MSENHKPTKPIIRVTIDEHGIWWKNTVQQDRYIGYVVDHLKAISLGTHDKRPRELAEQLARYRGVNLRQLPRDQGGVDEPKGSLASPDEAQDTPSG